MLRQIEINDKTKFGCYVTIKIKGNTTIYSYEK